MGFRLARRSSWPLACVSSAPAADASLGLANASRGLDAGGCVSAGRGKARRGVSSIYTQESERAFAVDPYASSRTDGDAGRRAVCVCICVCVGVCVCPGAGVEDICRRVTEADGKALSV